MTKNLSKQIRSKVRNGEVLQPYFPVTLSLLDRELENIKDKHKFLVWNEHSSGLYKVKRSQYSVPKSIIILEFYAGFSTY